MATRIKDKLIGDHKPSTEDFIETLLNKVDVSRTLRDIYAAPRSITIGLENKDVCKLLDSKVIKSLEEAHIRVVIRSFQSKAVYII